MVNVHLHIKGNGTVCLFSISWNITWAEVCALGVLLLSSKMSFISQNLQLHKNGKYDAGEISFQTLHE